MKKNILFVGAHPDDIELGCLGTILHNIQRERDRTICVVVSDGEAGNPDGSRFNRLEESTKCLTKMGVDEHNMHFLHIPDTELFAHKRRIFTNIEHIVTKESIHQVFVHTIKDYHQDHSTVFKEVFRAARNVPDLLTFESNSSTLPTFAPNYFVDITDYVDEKARLLENHESQKDRRYMQIDGQKALAMVRGNQSRTFAYAEAFEIMRMVRR